MTIARLYPLALALVAATAAAVAATVLQPQEYVATARVLLPANTTNGSRVLKIEHAASDPSLAVDTVNRLVSAQKSAVVIDAAAVAALRPKLGRNLALGAGAGLILGIGALLARERRRRPLRCERDLDAVLGQPILAARPMRPEVLRGLCRQLLEHWFDRHTVLPIVSPDRGDGRTRLAAELAVTFAEMGERTLLIDADFRSPGQHAVFSLPNRRGLADFLDGGEVQLAAYRGGKCGDNLAVLVAGAVKADPLELLACERLGGLLRASAKPFRVVLVDTPAAACGPDLQIFAAHAGGVLVVARRAGTDSASLVRLRAWLARCRARVVGTIFNAA